MTDKPKLICTICRKPFTGFGNDPWPIKNDGQCCDACNTSQVIPKRLRDFYRLTSPRPKPTDC